MEKINDRYEMAVQTLKTFKNALDLLQEKMPEKYYLGMCDSTIQRFEYSIDTFWKFLKIYLSDILKVTLEATSPRAVIREALNASVITSEEFDLLMESITRRNETSHAYNKELAQDILMELPEFYKVMHDVIERLSNSMNK